MGDRIPQTIIELCMHPRDFEVLEAAARMTRMGVDDFARLAIHLLASQALRNQEYSGLG
ncbi:hypothetical protein JFK97_18830 [Chromobacterium phragmitis]|uniref:hypothetical protein n=1 Tax=Chromobacterium amazonense TaxID=1382803 RepID=UPI0021B73DAB|nr:hypothetical protein [Chromobacterium amazonense]MBM2886447.1 hypothetical protein [Chromobacterium amazonense]